MLKDRYKVKNVAFHQLTRLFFCLILAIYNSIVYILNQCFIIAIDDKYCNFFHEYVIVFTAILKHNVHDFFFSIYI